MKAFGYVRLSKETDDTTSPQRQRKAIRKLCADRGWDLIEPIFEDIDVSAFNGNHRPQFEAMMARLAEADAIVFWKLDRLSRSTVQAGQIAKVCNDAGVNLVATDMDIDTTTSGGKFIYTILAAAGEMESDRISERTRSMMAYKRERDEWVGNTPYGWRVENHHLVKVPEEQKVIKAAAKAFIEGATWTELARKHGFTRHQVIRSILRSPRVQQTLGGLGLDLHAAIKARELERVPRSSRSLLGGIAKCTVCGKGLALSSTRASGPYTKCTAYRCQEVGHVGISGTWLEEHVSAAVLDAIDLKAITARMRERQRRRPAAEVLAIKARIESLVDAFGDGTLTKAEFKQQRARQEAKLAEAEERIADDAVADLPLDLARNLPERWPEMTIAGRRDVVRALVREVQVTKAPDLLDEEGKVIGTYHGPIDPTRVEIIWR